MLILVSVSLANRFVKQQQKIIGYLRRISMCLRQVIANEAGQTINCSRFWLYRLRERYTQKLLEKYNLLLRPSFVPNLSLGNL
jgi:hypothetical protein